MSSGTRQLSKEDVTEVQGVRVTIGSPPWPPSTASCAWVSPHDAIRLSVERFKGERGVVQLRWLVPLADGLAESPGESWLRLHWYDAGLPRPELQVWVHDENGVALYRLDIALPECRFSAEYDGKEFHSSDEQRRHDAERRTWLDEQGRWVIEVFEQEDVYPREADPTTRLREGAKMARTRAGLWVPESVRRDLAS